VAEPVVLVLVRVGRGWPPGRGAARADRRARVRRGRAGRRWPAAVVAVTDPGDGGLPPYEPPSADEIPPAVGDPVPLADAAAPPRFSVTAPEPISQPMDPRLGRLRPALAWLADVQGAWPPRRPSAPRSVVDEPGSLREGIAAADAAADSGADLLVLASRSSVVPGIIAAAALLDLEPVRAVGTAAGATADWAAQIVGVRSGLRACRPHLGDPHALLDAIASPVLSRLTGLLAQAAVRRTPVLLDGSALTAGAALLAERLAPGARAWWLAGHAPVAPAAALALSDLGLTPLLDLGLDVPAAGDVAREVLTRAVDLQAAAG